MRRFRFGLVVLLPVLWVLALSGQALAQVNAGVLFLRIAAGARAAGMGEAFVAVADDATATHWNPAGLGIYPLNSDWSEHELALDGTVLDAVALKNGLPDDRFTGYDLWILTDKGLTVYKVDEAGSGGGTVELPTAGVRSIEAAIRRYAGFLSEGDADAIARRTAAGTVGISAEQLQEVADRIANSIPADYRDRTVMENVLRELRLAHREGRIDLGQFANLRKETERLASADAAEELQLDRVRFAMERSISKQLPSTVVLDLTDLVQNPVTAIASDEDNLFVAAGNGLLTYDGRRWDAVDPPDGVEWESVTIHSLAMAPGRRLWVGVEDAVYVRHSGQWQKMGTEFGLPPGRVLRMSLAGSKGGWVYTDGGLASYDGTSFSPQATVAVNVGDSLVTTLSRFLGTDDRVALMRAADEVRALNGLGEGAVPEPGSELLVPYSLGLRGAVSAMSLDSFGRLWVGTDLGTFHFARGHWRAYGYEAFTPEEPTTAGAVAQQRLGDRATPDRVTRLAEYIARYNRLEDGQIAAGRTVYLYRNPAGSPVKDFGTQGNRLLVATALGQLEVKSGVWGRYFHADLDQAAVGAIVSTSRDVWFVSDDRIVVYQHPIKEISLMHSPWLPEFNLDLFYEYGTYTTNIEGLGTVGLSVTFLSFGEIPATDEVGNVLNLFHSFDGALALSYGTRLTPNLMAGLSTKVIFSRLAPQGAGAEIGAGSATAFALDAGFLYRTPWKRLMLGGALTNVGPNISYIDAQQSDPLPRNLALGFSYKVWSSQFNKLTVLAEINKELVDLTESASNEFEQIVYNMGVEYWYASSFAARFGYINDEDGQIKTITLGAGLAFKNLRFDLGYIPSQQDLPLANTARWGLTGRF